MSKLSCHSFAKWKNARREAGKGELGESQMIFKSDYQGQYAEFLLKIELDFYLQNNSNIEL